MKQKVLVADDDASIRTLIVKALESIDGAQPVEAADGDEAFALIESSDFDLIVTDWEMPGKSGLELLETIRARDRLIPVVMVTAHAEQKCVKEAIQAGVTDYLVKPFDQETLREKLKSLCQRPGFRVNATVYRCRNVMNKSVVTIRSDATVEEAIALLLQHGISGLPVVNQQDRLVGVITELELIQAIFEPDIKQQPVSTFMSQEVVTVKEDTIPLEVANLMEQHRIRRVPVVRNGKVVGVIARRDILRYVTENEDALREFLSTVKAAAGL